MVEAVIGLGSNLGDRLAHLQKGITGLASCCKVVAVSSVFETQPVGPSQPAYLNAAAIVETEMSPAQLMEHCLAIGQEAGRQRLEKWGPRTLDLDVLDIAGVTSSDPFVVVPHPYSHQRGFVLIPWAHIRPQWMHSAVNESVGELASRIDVMAEGINRRDDLALTIS